MHLVLGRVQLAVLLLQPPVVEPVLGLELVQLAQLGRVFMVERLVRALMALLLEFLLDAVENVERFLEHVARVETEVGDVGPEADDHAIVPEMRRVLPVVTRRVHDIPRLRARLAVLVGQLIAVGPLEGLPHLVALVVLEQHRGVGRDGAVPLLLQFGEGFGEHVRPALGEVVGPRFGVVLFGAVVGALVLGVGGGECGLELGVHVLTVDFDELMPLVVVVHLESLVAVEEVDFGAVPGQFFLGFAQGHDFQGVCELGGDGEFEPLQGEKKETGDG